MRGNELLDKMELTDPAYVEEAGNRSVRAMRRTRLRWAAVAACLALVIYAGSRLVPPGDPESTADLPMLSLSGNTGDGMGYEGYMAYDILELVNANPWNEDLELTTLPVYRNPILYATEFHLQTGSDFDRMQEVLLDVAGRLGLDPDSVSITDNEPDEEEKEAIRDKMTIAGISSLPDGYFDPTELILEAEGMTIDVDAFLTTEIRFDPPVSLPAEYNFTHYASYEEKAAAAGYLLDTYRGLIGMETPQLNLSGGDYDIYRRQKYQIEFFDASGSVTEQILNYNFNSVVFYCDDDGKLFLARVFQLDTSQKVGDYPIITVEQAEELLADGCYITSVPVEMPGMEYVKKVELIYRTGTQETYYMPYYRFYVELPDAEREDGLKDFGAYYVPAVSGDYISDLQTWDGSFN